MALQRPASKIEPFAGVPDLIDFPRDIQPILDRNCVGCHDYGRSDEATKRRSDEGKDSHYPPGGIVLSGDRLSMYSAAYWNLIFGAQVIDGANGYGNRPPRSIGSAASPLMNKIDGSHHDVKLTERERRLIWMWIESGATYTGTYAALATGTVGVSAFHVPAEPGAKIPAPRAAIDRRCGSCHQEPDEKDQVAKGKIPLPAVRPPRKPGEAAYERIVVKNDPMLRRASQALYNMTRPEKSVLLLAPLSKAAGGWESCGQPVFADTKDPDYQLLLNTIRRASQRLNDIKRFDMPGFKPNAQYVREMKRYGILPASFDLARDPIDVYQTDRAYWESMWWRGLQQ